MLGGGGPTGRTESIMEGSGAPSSRKPFLPPHPHEGRCTCRGQGVGSPAAWSLASHPHVVGHGPFCRSRQGICLSAFLLLLLVTLAALITLVTILGLPRRTPGQCGHERVGWTY